ncbi:hypothetical protein BKA70DRAFT_1289262 [Coprinopsis sp. MPI-PUGE-AT-0042]|nr:hypothetical protein BKA70DRAFT_1289262 [Coprinopsis sp. MPI-PUGE-AT-0042]
MPRYFHSVTSMQTSDISAESLLQPGRAVGNHTGNAARPIPCLPQELMIEVLEAFIGSIPLRDVRNELKNLALVCHSWLKIIRTTPSMWSRFYLHHEDFPKGAVPNNRLRPVLEKWMKKAGDMPLELEAHFSSSAVHGPPVLAKVLRQSASRWRALKLHVFHLLDFGVDSRADAQGPSDRIPVRWDRLESIELADAWYSETSTHILPATPLMPRLQSLTLISGLHYIPHLVVIFPSNDFVGSSSLKFGCFTWDLSSKSSSTRGARDDPSIVNLVVRDQLSLPMRSQSMLSNPSCSQVSKSSTSNSYEMNTSRPEKIRCRSSKTSYFALTATTSPTSPYPALSAHSEPSNTSLLPFRPCDRGYRGESTTPFVTSSWSVRLIEADLVVSIVAK